MVAPKIDLVAGICGSSARQRVLPGMTASSSPNVAAPGLAGRPVPEVIRPVAPASLLLVCAALLFAVMAVVAKTAAATLPGPEVAFVRFAIGLVVCGIASRHVAMRATNKLGLLLRGAYGGAAVLLYFLAIAHLPVGVATLLNYTAPVFTALYAGLFLGETVKTATLGALALTTTGVGLVIYGLAPAGSLGFGPWQMVGVGSAVLSGAAVATIREVRKTDGSWEIFAAFCVGGALVTAVPTAVAWVNPRPIEWALLIAVGLISVMAQLLLTYSLRFVRAPVAGVVAQLTPVAALAMGWILFRETIAGLAMVGAAVTLAGVTWGAYLASGAEQVPVEES
jgi:drug/metabolite transporter (DMT)-like permease